MMILDRFRGYVRDVDMFLKYADRSTHFVEALWHTLTRNYLNRGDITFEHILENIGNRGTPNFSGFVILNVQYLACRA